MYKNLHVFLGPKVTKGSKLIKKIINSIYLVNLLEFLNFIITYLEEDLHSLLCLPSPEKLNAALHSQTSHIRFEYFAF